MHVQKIDSQITSQFYSQTLHHDENPINSNFNGENSLSYTDMTKALLNINFQEIINTPSVTSVGRFFDWLLGWGKGKEQVNEAFIESFEVIRKVESKIDKVQKYNPNKKPTLQETKKTEKLTNSLENYYQDMQGNFKVNNCIVNGFPMNLWWYITFNAPLEEICASSQIPEKCANNYPICIQENGIPVYIAILATSTGMRNCLTTYGQINENTARFNFFSELLYYFNTIFEGQQNVSFPTEIDQICYEDNLTQEIPNQPPYTINKDNDGLQCADGTYELQYSNENCASRVLKQSFEFQLPSTNMPDPSSPYYQKLLENYCTCSIQYGVLKSFEYVQEANLEYCHTQLNPYPLMTYAIGSDGFLKVNSTQGFFSNQFNPDFDLNLAVQSCFNSSIKEYIKEMYEYNSENKHNRIIFLCAGGASLLAINIVACAAFAYRKKITDKIRDLKQKISEVQPSKNYQPIND
ncbi:MAG: hypothetical protein Q8K60_06915 [Parachlamydiaceae bacterium]|nr:hypothetical protein [Parachlamydiaceae bacterium]